jgi:imidazolonepropionase-like amidohydrolase
MSLSALASAETTLIHAGELLAVPGQSPSLRQTIVVTDNQIVETRNGFASAADFEGNVTIIDLSDKFVLPGLMDMHVHLQGELGPANDRDALKMSDQLMQMRSIHFAMNTLRAGFTTVRDVGSSSQEMYAMRDAIENSRRC